MRAAYLNSMPIFPKCSPAAIRANAAGACSKANRCSSSTGCSRAATQARSIVSKVGARPERDALHPHLPHHHKRQRHVRAAAPATTPIIASVPPTRTARIDWASVPAPRSPRSGPPHVRL